MTERLIDYLEVGGAVGREFISEETGKKYIVCRLVGDRRGYTFIEHKDGTRRNLCRSLQDKVVEVE